MVSIIVPVYNEADSLPKLVDAIRDSLDGVEHEVIVVDDDSTDGSGELAEQLARERGNIRVVHRGNKLGVASAIAEGIKVARGDVIGTINADMQHPPQLLPVMLQQLDGHGVVIGSRHVAGGHNNETPWRRFVSSVARTIARVLLPRTRSVRDQMSGFFLFKREVIAGIEVLPASSPKNISIGFKFLLGLLVKGSYESVVEVPYTFERRKAGKSKFALSDRFAYLRYVLYLMRTSGEFWRILKFALVGGSGIAVNMGVLFLLADRLGLLYIISAIFSWEVTILYMFAVNDLWTFGDLRRAGTLSTLKRALKFNIIRLISLAMYLAILVGLTELLGLHHLVSALIAIFVVMTWNYLVSLNFIWAR